MQEKLGLGEISCEGFFVVFSVPLREEWICPVATSVVGLLRKSVKMWRRREETMEQALAVIGMSSRAENLLDLNGLMHVTRRLESSWICVS